MRSRLAEELRRERSADAARIPDGKRLELAFALGERAIADYMANFAVDRAQAIRVLRQAGQAGRRYSACLNEDPHERARLGRR
jgi:hypothetical protein